MSSRFGTPSVLFLFPALNTGNFSRWGTQNNLPANHKQRHTLMSVEMIADHAVRIGGRHYRSLWEQPLLLLRVVREVDSGMSSTHYRNSSKGLIPQAA